MPNLIDPFADSKALSEWTVKTLLNEDVDQLAKWRMIEYWVQVELFRAVEAGAAEPWRHFGEYEQPYFTAIPRSSSKYNTKWIDLVFAEPSLTNPTRIVWIELKDLGRSAHTLINNARGLGQDLAALHTLDPARTKDLWLNPPEHAIDRGRLTEWSELAKGIEGASHLIAQIVLVPGHLAGDVVQGQIIDNWLGTFSKRTAHLQEKQLPSIARSDTPSFAVFALVAKPLCAK